MVALTFACLVIIGYEVFLLFLEWNAGLPLYSLYSSVDRQPTLGFAVLFALVYAIYRLVAFHPAWRPGGYYKWLRGTLWTSAKPLPLGPIHLVWQDVLLVGMAIAVFWPRLHADTLRVVQFFLGFYLVGLGIVHGVTGQRAWACAVGFGVGCMALFRSNLPAFCGAVGITYVFALLGLRAALARFPWGQCTILVESLGVKPTSPQATVGWPYARLGPRSFDDARIGWRDTILTGLLSGWWLFVAAHVVREAEGDEHDKTIDGGVYAVVLSFAIVFRLFIYFNGYLPPISLVGRLTTGRWLIPGYDQVFVAPLLAALVGVIAWYLRVHTGMESALVMPMALVLTLWILLGTGPDLKTWCLTGNHRIVRGIPDR